MTDGTSHDDADSAPVLLGWLSRKELAGQLGLSEGTLARWGSLGIGPIFVRVGFRVFYRRESVREWLVELERARRARK
jgi:hypothetical protein